MIRKILAGLVAVIVICLVLTSCQNTAKMSFNEESLGADTESSTKSVSEWVNTPIFKDFIFFDADGDGMDDHVVEHNMVAMSGGHGGYELYIYEKSDVWGYDEIFNSDDYFTLSPNMNIQISGMSNGRIILQHQPTGYDIEYIVNEESYPYLFSEDGTPIDNPNFAIDTFKTVKVNDVDEDGAEELVMRQYVSIGCHANYIGDCESVWKIVNSQVVLMDLRLIFRQ